MRTESEHIKAFYYPIQDSAKGSNMWKLPIIRFNKKI